MFVLKYYNHFSGIFGCFVCESLPIKSKFRSLASFLPDPTWNTVADLAYATDYSQNHKQSLKIIEHVPAFRMLYFTRNIRGLDELKPGITDRSLAEYIVKAVACVWTVAYV